MKNKLIIFLCITTLNGCYTTAPIYWSKVRRESRDTITSREVIPNGSRLEIQAVTQNGQIDITTKSIPQCRLADIGYEIITEKGQRVPHSWPGTVFGVVMMGGGTAMLADGLSSSDSDSSDRKDIRTAETIGGIAIMAGGAILTGVCALSVNGCAADPDEDTRTYNGTPFKRWDERSDVVKKDCESSPPQSPGIVPLEISVQWENAKKPLIWNKSTDENGTTTVQILDTVRRVSAHCGKAKIEIVTTTRNKEDRVDSASNPSRARNDSGGFRLSFPAVTKIESPDFIKNDDARRIAQACFDNRSSSCIDPLINGIKEKCLRNCNSESGAEMCQIELETQLVPSLSDAEKSILRSKYDTCVLTAGIDQGKASQCTSKCVEQASTRACPRGW